MLGFIPDWLTNWFLGAARVVGQSVADVIHWAVHALAMVIIAVFDRVYKAWAGLAGWTWAYLVAVGKFIFWVVAKIWHILKVVIPDVLRFVLRWVAYLLKFIRSWVAWLWGQIRATIALLYRQISLVIRWAVTHIWDPLWKWAQFLYRLVKAWAWVAFWWITHPADLAGRLFWFFIGWLEHFAWEAGGKLGTFGLALVRRNLPRFLHLVDSIISAVL